MILDGRRILLVIGGGIAAYKSLDLIRRLRERGARVRPVLTAGAQHFITPLSAAALCGEPAHTDLFDRNLETEIGHIRLARDADAIVVAPATANLMARMAGGHADDLATTILLATTLPILIAPAMNVRMWQHPATQRNLATLKDDGVQVVGPNEGAMAEAEWGPGRLAEPLEIVAALEGMIASGITPERPIPSRPHAEVPAGGRPRSTQGGASFEASLCEAPQDEEGGSPRSGEVGKESGRALSGRHVLVTSGPTHEPIDPVRYIANRSSGRQGHAIAAAAAAAGARVTLVSGPVAIPDPAGVEIVHVESAREMLAAVEKALPADIAIFAAAVADWRAAGESEQKLKKDGSEPPPLRLALNPDILKTVAHLPAGRPPLVVGFAAETERVIEHAQAKLARKGCDLIVANDVSPGTGIMGGAENAVHLVTAAGVESWPSLGKEEVARRLVARFAELAPRANVKPD
ncbi:phosphopantothenoylcysteine decarboxylase [Enterovirga rhinocerotis]|uniref:Coenzyme A biosynthesis bifunctional protein CoaBC n=1 Tax=Enterovirga rhinocerotis TaxID=1339210 RepID=A0A4R7BS33_9HYPH|nr:phosphopantothenoylcysteine decarboxylase [Enterovirga rhinocerotis]TDR87275.1 phosphopantothenoylcysteine decarboxylase/phosphopantothenate--cysteine ligase [Enterovirga rhinocerotis]